jgi:hypothetical protein
MTPMASIDRLFGSRLATAEEELKALLLARGGQRIVVINVPW